MRTHWTGLLLISVLLTSCVSRIETYRVTNPASPAVGKGQGVFYALPRTVVAVHVPVTRKTWAAGRLTDLLPYFFPCDEIAPKPAPYTAVQVPDCGSPGVTYPEKNSEFAIDPKTIAIGTTSEPDPDQVFMIKINGGRMEDRKLNVLLSESGILDSFEAEITNRTGEVISQIAKSSVAVLGKAITQGILSVETNNNKQPQHTANTTVPSCPDAKPPLSTDEGVFIRLLADNDLGFFCKLNFDQRTQYQEMSYRLRVGFREYADATPLDDQKLRRFLAGFASFVQIKELAQLLGTNLKSSEGSLTGDVPPDTLRIRVEKVEAQLSDKVGEFFGSLSQRVAWDAQFEVRLPDKGPVSTLNLFEYETGAGICTVDRDKDKGVRLAGLAPSLATCSGKKQVIDLAVNLAANNPATAVASRIAGAVKSSNEAGIFYRVPGDGLVSILRKTVEESTRTTGPSVQLALAAVSLAQAGVVVALPQSTGGRKTAYTFSLYGASGALKNFKMNTEAAFDKSSVSDIEAVLTGAAALNPSELEALKRQREIADEREKLRDKTPELDEVKKQRELAEEQLKLIKAQNELEQATKAAAGQQ